MTSRKTLWLSVVAGGMAISGMLYAADHIDAPAVTNQSSDITDLYVFQGQNPDNLVFVANTQGLLSPGATAAAHFDDDNLIEFNVDNNGDNVEDLVIQCISKNGKMQVYGPYKPAQTGARSSIDPNAYTGSVAITGYGEPEKMASEKGIKIFAGPRDDPFFFDLNQYLKILGGSATSFNNPGSDAFAGTNVLSVVLEMPKTMLGGSGSLNVWAETKSKKIIQQ